MSPPRYPSDLSDQEWAILEPLLSSAEKRGRPPKWPHRHVADAVFYLLRSGCSWRMLPREYPPWQTLYYHLRQVEDRRPAAPSSRPSSRSGARIGRARPSPQEPPARR